MDVLISIKNGSIKPTLPNPWRPADDEITKVSKTIGTLIFYFIADVHSQDAKQIKEGISKAVVNIVSNKEKAAGFVMQLFEKLTDALPPAQMDNAYFKLVNATYDNEAYTQDQATRSKLERDLELNANDLLSDNPSVISALNVYDELVLTDPQLFKLWKNAFLTQLDGDDNDAKLLTLLSS